jgi:outer membrane protein OmpA-like peptidoglycan-associated protein
MLAKLYLRRGAKAEGESPFWISFSDLMSALMVLFLVVMAVTLVTITKKIEIITDGEKKRTDDIAVIMKLIAADPLSQGITVDDKNYRIDLGKEVRFDSGSYTISAPAGEFLRRYLPVLLKAKATPQGQRWMRSIVVEGFTDEDGTYLYNLELSLNRSRSVVCSLFDGGHGQARLSADELLNVQELFLVGGYSFNSVKPDKAASRRVEFKIDFWRLGEEPTVPSKAVQRKDFGQCRL